jgi:hypothetical protein
MGYWGGIHQDSELGAKYKLCQRDLLPGCQWGRRRSVVDVTEAGRFFDDFYG